jgi:hypothetical protein
VLRLDGYHAALVMSHHLQSDAHYLCQLADSNTKLSYVGLLGPAARRERLLTMMGLLRNNLISRLRSPVGLNLGAVTPEGIALAIVRELHACFAGKDAEALCASVHKNQLNDNFSSPLIRNAEPDRQLALHEGKAAVVLMRGHARHLKFQRRAHAGIQRVSWDDRDRANAAATTARPAAK